MPDTYEQNLGQKASLTTSDFIRVVGSDNVSYKQRVDKVMGDMGVYTWKYGYTNPQVSALGELKDSGFYTIGSASFYSDAPQSAYGFLAVFHGGSYAVQIYYAFPSKDSYIRQSTNNGSSWSDWLLQPTRAEMDTRVVQDINWHRSANLNDFMTTGVYWIADAPTNAPSSSWGWFGLAVMGRGDTTRQIAINTEGVVCVRAYQGTQGWREWIQQPTREEVDALNSKVRYKTVGTFSCPTTPNYASTGQSFTIEKPMLIRVSMTYVNGRPTAIGLKTSEQNAGTSTLLNAIDPSNISNTAGISASGFVPAGTYYIWARSDINGTNNVSVTGIEFSV